MRGSYYDVLGVSPSASEEDIRARYLRLIRRYHPDRNRSPLAHARTADINEAFHFLSDPELRAWHDAQLAVRRQDVVTARALDLSRGGGRALVVHRGRRPLLQRYGARLALAALLVATVAAGWQIDHRLLVVGGDAALAALASDATDHKAHRAVEALEAATAQDAQYMPPVSSAAVAGGAGAYRRIAAAGDLAQARMFSERCQTQAADAEGWNALDYCVAFDQAAFVGIAASAASASDEAYFVDRHDRAAHLYVSRVSSLDAIDRRLDQIRAQVGTPPPPRDGTARVLHGISKRGWKLAGAAWRVFGGPDAKAGADSPHARDF